jgi:hypothetical protein
MGFLYYALVKVMGADLSSNSMTEIADRICPSRGQQVPPGQLLYPPGREKPLVICCRKVQTGPTSVWCSVFSMAECPGREGSGKQNSEASGHRLKLVDSAGIVHGGSCLVTERKRQLLVRILANSSSRTVRHQITTRQPFCLPRNFFLLENQPWYISSLGQSLYVVMSRTSRLRTGSDTPQPRVRT